MPDDSKPDIVRDPLLDENGQDDLHYAKSIKGHQHHSRTDPIAGGADSSPLESVTTDERLTTPPKERMSSPDEPPTGT